MNENHTMHIQSDYLTYWRAGIYFTHAWGVYLLCCSQFLFSCCLRLSHRERKDFMAGPGEGFGVFVIWVMGWRQQSSSASEKESFDCRLYQDAGNWELFLLISLFRISCQLFLSLPISSSYAGPFDHAGVEFGSTEKYKLFLLLQFGLLFCDVDELSRLKQCICTAPGPCIVINELAFDPASLAPYVERDRSLVGRSHTCTDGRLSSVREVETRWKYLIHLKHKIDQFMERSA